MNDETVKNRRLSRLKMPAFISHPQAWLSVLISHFPVIHYIFASNEWLNIFTSRVKAVASELQHSSFLSKTSSVLLTRMCCYAGQNHEQNRKATAVKRNLVFFLGQHSTTVTQILLLLLMPTSARAYGTGLYQTGLDLISPG